MRGIPTCAPSKVTAALPRLMQAWVFLSNVRVEENAQMQERKTLLGAVIFGGQLTSWENKVVAILPQTLIDLFESCQ